MDLVVKSICVLMLAFMLQYIWQIYKLYTMPEPVFDDLRADGDDFEHANEFKPQIIKVTEGVYIALGYGLANSILLHGPQGLIIVDTMESMTAAEDVYSNFRKLFPNERIKAVMYTHNHADHTMGAKVFADDPGNPPEVWAHESLWREFEKVVLTAPIIHRRAARQFGTLLTNLTSHAGIGLRLRFDSKTNGFLPPTRLFPGSEMTVEIAGLKLKLFHIPGETYDHMGIWMEDKQVFLSGDDIYMSFPNLYAIRGTPSRDTMLWVKSIDKIRKLNPEHLIPSHGPPITGRENIKSILTTYRDTIQFVHDQTLRWMNKDLHPNVIAKLVKLPAQLANHRYLKEFYGTVEWSSKGVFSSYLGWFSGDIVELSPIMPDDKAKRMVALVAGTSALTQAAADALKALDYQWALELSSHVLLVDGDDHEAAQIRLEALVALARKQTSSNGKHYYLTNAVEFAKQKEITATSKQMVMVLPFSILFSAMSTKVKAESCGETNILGYFNFTDTQEQYQLHLRNGIIETSAVNKEAENTDFGIEATSNIWREIMAQTRSPLMALASGDAKVTKGFLNFKTFFDCLEKD